jgi:hypothetical protein
VKRSTSTDTAASFLRKQARKMQVRKRQPNGMPIVPIAADQSRRVSGDELRDLLVLQLSSPRSGRAQRIHKRQAPPPSGVAACRDSLRDLRPARCGEYGWVVHQHPLTARCRVLWYGADRGSVALCSWCRSDESGIPVPHRELKSLPPSYFGPKPILDWHPGDGAVYAIATMPDVRFSRLKVGWTTDLKTRTGSYITLAPTLLLLGLWPGCIHSEDIAHAAVDGRIGDSEVFDCHNVWHTLESLRHVMESGCDWCSDDAQHPLALGAAP